MTQDTVLDPLDDALGWSLWFEYLREKWSALNDAWVPLSAMFLDNLLALNDNYDTPRDALFALLTENEATLETLASDILNATNPFMIFDVTSQQAKSSHLAATAQATAAYTIAKSQLDEDYAGQQSQTQQNFDTAIDSATTAYTQTNQAANDNAIANMDTLNYVYRNQTGQGGAESAKPSVYPKASANDIGIPGHQSQPTPEDIRKIGKHLSETLEKYREKIQNDKVSDNENTGSSHLYEEFFAPDKTYDSMREVPISQWVKEEQIKMEKGRGKPHNSSYEAAIAKILEIQNELYEKTKISNNPTDILKYKYYTLLVNQFEEWSRHPNSDYAFAAEVLGIFLDINHEFYDNCTFQKTINH